jgi:hypothetical protein
MSNIAKIYSAWEHSAEALAADLGEKGVTVRQWRNRESIPPEHWAAIIEKAAARGVDIAVDDFGPNAAVLAVARALAAEARDAA